jgi:diadenosine tetraphosphate (Ap4A) HIT family hydrolase
MDPATAGRVFEVSRVVGQAIDRAFRPRRVGVMIVGDEVPHAHVHLVPIDHVGQLSFAAVDRSPDPAALDDAAERIRAELRAMGRAEVAG